MQNVKCNGKNYLIMLATSSAKFSSFFARPSPFSKRANATTLISPPSALPVLALRIERTVENQKTAVGDRVHVRYVVTADRDYEYVRLAAPRPAAAEPESQHSGYRWHDGLGYYVAQHDASTEYFIDRLPRGTYVIEEDWLIAHAGAYTLVPALLQCLYAPEFQAHTAGGKITVEP